MMLKLAIFAHISRLVALAFGAMFINLVLHLGWEFQTGVFLLGWAIMPDMREVK